MQSAGVNDCGKYVKEETTSTSFNTQQGQSISSQVAAANATANNEYGGVRNQPVLQNKTVITTAEENKFFGPGGEQEFCALPSR